MGNTWTLLGKYLGTTWVILEQYFGAIWAILGLFSHRNIARTCGLELPSSFHQISFTEVLSGRHCVRRTFCKKNLSEWHFQGQTPPPNNYFAKVN